MTSPITIKTPGKLMVAGEFAVLEPYHQLIVMAVDRFLYTTIKDNKTNEVHIKDFKLYNQRFHFDGKRVNFEKEGPAIRFVKDALTITLTYLKEKKIYPKPFSLTIKSELDDQETGQKYGLGSSAAVVTSVVTAVLTKFLPETPSKELIFKLASISHIKTQGNGSGADIAASTYGGILLFSSFQAEWLLTEIENANSVKEIVEKDWTYLSIRSLKFPTQVQLVVGWTGKPASTKSLVSEIREMKKDNRNKYYEAFLKESKRAVLRIVEGMENDDAKMFTTGIEQNRKALSEVGKRADVEIETEKLYTLSKEANKLGGVGKLSGAGGGDCGIAFLPMDKDVAPLEEAWQKNGIKPLKMNVHPYGSEPTFIKH
mgnify:CR=1 FL=1